MPNRISTANIAIDGAARSDHLGNLALGQQWWMDYATNKGSTHVENANTTDRQEDFEQVMDRLKLIQERELMLAGDLISAGLTVDADVTSTVITVDNEADMGEARVDLNVALLDDDQTTYGQTSTPNPIIHKSYNIPFRQEGFSYKRTSGEGRSMRAVMDKTESIVTNGDTSIVVTINGAAQTLSGYTTHSDRTTRTISDWTTATTDVLKDVRDMLSDLFVTNGITARPGSVNMYVANNLWIAVLREDAFAGKGGTFMEEILRQNPEIGAIKPAEKMTDDEVVLVVMEDQYVQLAVSQTPIVVPHIKTAALQPQRFTTYAIWAPIIHVDSNSKTGIVHGST